MNTMIPIKKTGTKWGFTKNRYKKALNTQPAFTFKGMDCVYFTSKEIADVAVQTIGKERILKYMFDIESEEEE